MPLTVWWIRRDLRLHDNQALHTALQYGAPILPLFIIDPQLLRSSYLSVNRLAFLYGGLRALASDLAAIGSRLVVRTGSPQSVLAELVANYKVTQIVAEADVSPYARQRDDAIQATLPLSLTPGVAIEAVGAVRKDDGKPYTVYTPFNRRWAATTTLRDTDILSAPAQLNTPPEITSEEIPTTPSLSPSIPFVPGEAEARVRLARFMAESSSHLYDYAQLRDRPDMDQTSQLSPYIRFGMISMRVLAVAAQKAMYHATDESDRTSAQKWLDELLWRDFYQTILLHFPHCRRSCFYPKYDGIQWQNNESDFAAWCQGQTGYPYIDAAMRQLATIGWMHNRPRMAVASFLIKDLLIDWRWGERWFMQNLLDGDPASNNGGWQWTAGTGPNAAPYFRVYNPVMQSEKFDPDGIYIRRWVPELESVSTKFIHSPWQMSASEQSRARCIIGRDYPAPIVDHESARDRMLVAYKQAIATEISA